MSRYDTNPDEAEVLPNKLGLTDPDSVNEEEAAGFLRAELAAIDALSGDTVFTLEYLYDLHQQALGHLYDFAGRLRTVNLSKGGFMFAPAQFLPQTLEAFAGEYVAPLNAREWESEDALRDALADMHAELLYIHPFREGNGRIIRLFTKLLFLAKTGEVLDFEHITEGDHFTHYIAAVQQAASGRHDLMRELFRELRA